MRVDHDEEGTGDPMRRIVADTRLWLDHEVQQYEAGPDVEDLLDRIGARAIALEADVASAHDSRARASLSPLLADARELIDAELDAHRSRPPGLTVDGRRPPAAQRSRYPWLAVAAALLIVAASASALVAAPGMVPRPSIAMDLAEYGESMKALSGHRAQPAHFRVEGATKAFIEPVPGRSPPRTFTPDRLAVPGPGASSDPELAGVRAGVAADAAHNESQAESTASRSSLAQLDAQAQAQWRAGDLVGARRSFEEIVRLGKRSSWAEQAFGELFTLNQRLEVGEGERRRLYRRYLARFPRGRYADSTRAKLCRSIPASERAACWEAYLKQHPGGAHRQEARTMIAE